VHEGAFLLLHDGLGRLWRTAHEANVSVDHENKVELVKERFKEEMVAESSSRGCSSAVRVILCSLTSLAGPAAAARA
jgi:hypothetical protein